MLTKIIKNMTNKQNQLKSGEHDLKSTNFIINIINFYILKKLDS